MATLESVTEELERVEVRDKVDEDERSDSDPAATLRTQFSVFAKFGDTAADGKTIKLSQSDKWFRQAGLITRDARDSITTTDTGIAFKKVAK